ncbi:MAG: hypothetical protein M9952_10950 [Microthrixaceae bacterium]|nr:hypothetical protein [Microthrixaceae bacterium]
MRSHPIVWLLRVAWLVLPLTLGTVIEDALDGRSTPVVVVTAVLSWTLWALGLGAALVTVPAAHAVLRWVVPIALVAGITSMLMNRPDTGERAAANAFGVIGLIAALVATACAFAGVLANEYANGAAYGDERRFALRIPAGFLLGPIPVFWAATAGGLVGGPILLAAQAWLPGTLTLIVGLVAAPVAARSFLGLSRRWLVFVPAGVTLVDHLALSDPVLFSKARITRFGPAFTDTVAKDLTSNAAGLVIELAFDQPLDISVRIGRDQAEVELVRAVLITPVRPGAVMQEAARRGLPTSAQG